MQRLCELDSVVIEPASVKRPSFAHSVVQFIGKWYFFNLILLKDRKNNL